MPVTTEKTEGFVEYLYHSRKILKESSLALLATIITSVVAGLFLGGFRHTLLLVPGLIILIPGTISMRGTILGAMGSRLGSAYHLGLIKKISFSEKLVRANAYATFILSTYLSFILAIYAELFATIFGVTSVSMFEMIAISFIGSTISMLALFAMSIGVAHESTKHGWDVDNIQAPLVASFGDLITIPALFATVLLLPYFRAHSILISAAVMLLIGVSVGHFIRTETMYEKIVKQSILVLSFGAILSTIAGTFLQHQVEQLVAVPVLLVLLPAFVGEGGNIGSIFASRIGTLFNLGIIKPKLGMKGEMQREIAHTYVFALVVYPIIAIATYVLARATGLNSLGPVTLVLISLAAGAILTTLITFLAFGSSIVAYKHGIDPDNVLIPIVASAADFLGVACLFGVLFILGIL